MAEDEKGHLWLGTAGGGITTYDGRTFQSVSMKDGLASNNVEQISFEKDGSVWLLHLEETVTRYTPRKTAPSVIVTQAVADENGSEPRASGNYDRPAQGAPVLISRAELQRPSRGHPIHLEAGGIRPSVAAGHHAERGRVSRPGPWAATPSLSRPSTGT
jgi:ligand-binding sensor domain-containing protein